MAKTKIYTKNGDNGKTQLIGAGKVSKSDPIFEVLGTLDELNVLLGFVEETELQKTCLALGALIAAQKCTAEQNKNFASRTKQIEKRIDKLEKQLPPLRKFILPSGTTKALNYHLTRVVCRRLERALVHLSLENPNFPCKNTISYLNRLSDLLFVLARHDNFTHGFSEKVWE